MPKLFEVIQANPLVAVLGLLVAVMLVHFLFQYIFRGLGLRAQLIDLATRVGSTGTGSPESIKPALNEIFRDTRLARSWREFEESLHEQRLNSDTARGLVAIRATQPAEAFFNLETVVDPWIGSDYFKHLPGILTGFGIIGTFFGLIQGLIHFDPGLTDSADLKRGLGELFGHVRDAFMFSGSAIAAAIAVTIAEKWLYSSCAKWVLELSTALDGMFKTGVGEEYLAAILKSSRDGASQVRYMKEALVQELRSVLTDLTDRQIQATQQMSTDVGRSIRQSLQDPMADIARTVAVASGRDTEAVRHVFEQLMTSVIGQMRETTGRQMSELTGLIQQTAQTVQKVESAMHGVLKDVQNNSKESAAGMQAATQDLADRLFESQRTQSEIISASMRGVLQQLNESTIRMATMQEDLTRRAREGNETAVGRLRRQVESVTESQAATIAATRDLLERFSGVSTEVIGKMASAATAVVAAVQSLQVAAERMAHIGKDLANLEGHVQKSSNDMIRASSHLASVAQSVGSSTRQLGEAAVRFEGVASSASVEANARRQLLISLQDVIEQSHAASREFVKLAQDTRKALGSSVAHFESDVGNVLAGHVRIYQQQLGDSVSSLRRALDQIAVRAGRDHS